VAGRRHRGALAHRGGDGRGAAHVGGAGAPPRRHGRHRDRAAGPRAARRGRGAGRAARHAGGARPGQCAAAGGRPAGRAGRGPGGWA
jgi:hypothetical protein